MNKYIDVKDARNLLAARLLQTALNNDGIDYVYEDIVDNRLDIWLNEIPAADVQEVRHGRWIKITNDWVDDAQYVCSCCGRLLTVSNRLTELVSMSYPYCHCGAKMDEVEE